MVEHTSGIICVALEGRELDRLGLPLMVESAENEEAMYTAFTVSADARHGITTGSHTCCFRALAIYSKIGIVLFSA